MPPIKKRKHLTQAVHSHSLGGNVRSVYDPESAGSLMGINFNEEEKNK
ncbi:hypothetical protein [Chryseobacterium sp. 7]|nr:hypothetical protein [Chryseobacterium sp. 7]